MSDHEQNIFIKPEDNNHFRAQARSSFFWPIALFVSVFILFSLSWPYTLYGWGLGISLTGAERVLAGDIPYRDFWTMYAPGHYYLLAILLRIFGHDAIVSVVSGTLIFAVSAVLLYYLAQRLYRHVSYSLFCALVFSGAAAYSGYFHTLGSYPPAILLIIGSLYLFYVYLSSRHLGYLVCSGLAVSTAALFKHDVAAYAALAIGAGILVDLFFRRLSILPSTRGKVSALAIFCASAASLIFPVSMILWLLAGNDVVQSTIIFPATDFPHSRGESYPGLLPGNLYDPWKLQMVFNISRYYIFALPFLICMGSALMIFHRALTRTASTNDIFAFALIIAYLLHYFAAHVQINTHIISISMYSALMGLYILSSLQARLNNNLKLLVNITSVGIGLIWLLALFTEPVYLNTREDIAATEPLSLSKAASTRQTPDTAKLLNDLVPYVQDLVPPGQSIYIGTHRHDIVIVNDALLYFLIDRPSGTKYHELHPAVTDTQDVQEEIAEELERNKVQVLVLQEVFSDQELDTVKRELRKNLPEIGARHLDRYIAVKYDKIKEFDKYSVWMRHPAPEDI